MGNMSLSGGGGQTGGTPKTPKKNPQTARTFIKLRDKAAEYVKAGQPVPESIARALRKAQKDM